MTAYGVVILIYHYLLFLWIHLSLIAVVTSIVAMIIGVIAIIKVRNSEKKKVDMIASTNVLTGPIDALESPVLSLSLSKEPKERMHQESQSEESSSAEKNIMPGNSEVISAWSERIAEIRKTGRVK